jgi:energy-coupling factor transporter ATP-binding protein EcfA2
MSTEVTANLCEPIATVEGLSFTYAGASNPVLLDLNFQIMPGEFVVITGPSGCGKSTLALCLTGFIPHAFSGEMKGTVRISGVDTRQVLPGKLAGISGLVQQDPEAQLCTLKVIDEVAFGPENLRLPPGEIKKRIEWALGAVDSLDLLFKDVHTLSGGEKQRVAIASVLAMRPGLLILDEPTANLDPRSTVEVLQAIESLRSEKNTAIIVIEHRLSKVLPLADRLIVMEEGKITAMGRPRETGTCYRKKLLIRKRRVLPDFKRFFGGQENPGDSDKPLLVAENITAGYTERPVLAGINFQLYPGEFSVLMGDNGSGKTSLLHVLLGILKPWEGRVLFQEKDVTSWSVAQRARFMGLTFQNPNHQLFEKTVLREAGLPRRFLGQGEEKDSAVIENLLEYFGLLPYKESLPQALSMGEKKRLTFISVLAYYPPLLLLDEPLVGQDEENLAYLGEILHEYRKRGGAVLMICHEPAVVRAFDGRVLFLEAGKLIVDAPSKEAFLMLKENGYGEEYY